MKMKTDINKEIANNCSLAFLASLDFLSFDYIIFTCKNELCSKKVSDLILTMLKYIKCLYIFY